MTRAAFAWLGAATWACGGGAHAAPDAARDAALDAPPVPAPDLRFQWVDASPRLSISTIGNIATSGSAGGGGGVDANGGFGPSTMAPLQLSLNGAEGGAYSWDLALVTPSPMTQPLYGHAFALTDAQGDLDELLGSDLAASGGIVASVDIVPGAFAYVVDSAMDGAGYAVVGSDVGSGELADYVAAEAGSGRVVTAVSASPTAGLVRVYSAARAGDASVYATTVAAVSTATFADTCEALAGSGYVITAFGHVGFDAGFVVGTQRGSAALVATEDTGLSPASGDGAALVGWNVDVDGADGGNQIIFEQ